MRRSEAVAESGRIDFRCGSQDAVSPFSDRPDAHRTPQSPPYYQATVSAAVCSSCQAHQGWVRHSGSCLLTTGVTGALSSGVDLCRQWRSPRPGWRCWPAWPSWGCWGTPAPKIQAWVLPWTVHSSSLSLRQALPHRWLDVRLLANADTRGPCRPEPTSTQVRSAHQGITGLLAATQLLMPLCLQAVWPFTEIDTNHAGSTLRGLFVRFQLWASCL